MKLQNCVFGLGMIVTSLVAAQAASASEGGGYNGPVTAGDSIPVQLDRAVSLDGLTRTYQGCTARLARDVVRQYVKMTPAAFEAAYESHDQDIGGGEPNWNFSQNGDRFDVNFRRYTLHSYRPKDQSGEVSSISFIFGENYGFHLGSDPYASMAQAFAPTLRVEKWATARAETHFRAFSLPLATFSNTLNQAKYDELGNLDESTVILSGLSLKIPADYQDQVTLVNDQSSLPSALKLNLKGFVDCFYNEIQK